MVRIRLNLQIVSAESTFTKEPIYDFCLFWFWDRLKKPSNPRRIKWPVEQGWALATATMVGNSISASVCHICTNLKELLVEGSNWIGLLIETKN